MKDIVYFFWCRWHRAVCMDSVNKELGKPTHYWIAADEWVEAYKNTLSKNKQRDFDKEWDKLETQLETFRNDTKGKAESPFKY